MEKTSKVVRKRVQGRIDYNNGEFAEIQIVGTEGIEKDLWLDTIQIHREDTEDTPEAFKKRLPFGTVRRIFNSTQITAQDWGRRRTT
jgi:hypothetical protein